MIRLLFLHLVRSSIAQKTHFLWQKALENTSGNYPDELQMGVKRERERERERSPSYPRSSYYTATPSCLFLTDCCFCEQPGRCPQSRRAVWSVALLPCYTWKAKSHGFPVLSLTETTVNPEQERDLHTVITFWMSSRWDRWDYREPWTGARFAHCDHTVNLQSVRLMRLTWTLDRRESCTLWPHCRSPVGEIDETTMNPGQEGEFHAMTTL